MNEIPDLAARTRPVRPRGVPAEAARAAARLCGARGLLRPVCAAGALWLSLAGLAGVSPQLPLEIQQHLTTFNLQSKRGVPLSTTAGTPVGSDGRAPDPTSTPKQFQSWVGFGGLTLSKSNYVAVLKGVNVYLLKSAKAGAPYFGRQMSYLFGAIVAVPETDETGKLLSTRTPPVDPEDYWRPEPRWLTKDQNGYHTNAPYYWSPHAQRVYAVQAGPISITWVKAQPSTTQPSGTQGVNWYLEAGLYYTIFTDRYIVSGSPVKEPRQMYWTQGAFANTGHPVVVPAERVGEVQVVYSSNFPKYVETEYVPPGEVPPQNAPGLGEYRTLWYDEDQGQLFAYNYEGRVFVELLGDLRPDGQSRVHLGFEIVDVLQQPTPVDVTTELGESLNAWPDGRDDSDLKPSPIRTAPQDFVYELSVAGNSSSEFYAVQETKNLNDYFLHWLETGEEGLLWPSRFVRYAMIWPPDPDRYSHYLRPLVATASEAAETAVPLPLGNVPVLEYEEFLDQTRAFLTADGKFYTWLDAANPAHRSLLRFNVGNAVAFERVFSWLDVNLKGNTFAGSVATNLSIWNPNTSTLVWSNPAQEPRVVDFIAYVGDRLTAPPDELGGAAGSDYWAGHLRVAAGDLYNPGAYVDPLVAGFEAASLGAIIPVNAMPNRNRLEVWWFRRNGADLTQGFEKTYWPSVIGRYTINWPANAREIVLASNDGSGGLSSLEAKAAIYYQNDPAQPGYNPNEEHALMVGGQAYALRDDLNVTSGTGYTSAPYVLLEYTADDGRPKLSAFHVLREKSSAGLVFDFLTEAGTLVQAPMPLPLLERPVEGEGADAKNYNMEPPATGGDLPGNWNVTTDSTGPYAHYARFTYQDRKHEFWVYRALHAGTPALAAGTYNPTAGTFGTPVQGRAVVASAFNYTLHASRIPASLAMTSANLPSWLSIGGLTLTGKPQAADAPKTNTVTLVIRAVDDGAAVTNSLTIVVATTGAVTQQGPLTITSLNSYTGSTVTYSDRPPYLAVSPTSANSFVMRFYYKTKEGFAWPGIASPPPVGSIVPYLRPKDANGAYVGDPTKASTASLSIVYRPYWPYEDRKLPKLDLGDTLTVPKHNLPAVRGQTSLQLLYQQSLAADLKQTNNFSALLHDPTREKEADLATLGLPALPAGVRTDSRNGRVYFPNLPPHLEERVFFDPSRGAKGRLVLRGEFVDDSAGEKYLLLNVLRGTDLATVKNLCPAGDADKTTWDSVVAALTTRLETFVESTEVPGSYVPDTDLDRVISVGDLCEVVDDDTAVDSYALSASGPGVGYLTLIAGNGLPAFTPAGDPVSVYIIRATPAVYRGEVKALLSDNPMNELVTFQHTPDLANRFDEYSYEWRIGAPVDGLPPIVTPSLTGWELLSSGTNQPRYTLGGEGGVQVLADNYVIMRYKPVNPRHPRVNVWSDWTAPALAEGWIKRVLAGINPFNQRTSDLFNNRVNTDVSIVTQAGPRYEGDVALNPENIDKYGLIEVYETVLRRGRMLSIDSGINYGPANDALLLVAGYLNDLYMTLGNEGWADAANPTIGIGTKDRTYGDIATALFSFKGQMSSLLEEELALLRGRDDFLQPGVQTAPVFHRLVWNYTRGIDSGEVIYALNYDIQEDPDREADGIVDADDARFMYPQGHGDAYGHYLTAVKDYYYLLTDADFDWVPRTEAVTVLGQPVQVDYLDERKFASAAAATVRAAGQVFDLTWRRDYQAGGNRGWQHFAEKRENSQRTPASVRYWGLDHWASRAAQGAYVHWVVANAILPETDTDPTHEGIQKIDRTTVPELQELAAFGEEMQTRLDNAEAGMSPLGLPEGSITFDINPTQVAGVNPQTHFEQICARAERSLNNAVAAFDDAKDVTRLMRSEQDSLVDFQAQVSQQERSYTNSLIEIYGTPYPEDIGPGRTYSQGYAGPDLIHYSYVDLPEIVFPELWNYTEETTYTLDLQNVPDDWTGTLYTDFDFIVKTDDEDHYAAVRTLEFNLGPHGFSDKPTSWTGRRASPGRIQQAISELIRAHRSLKQALFDNAGGKADLDKAIRRFESTKQTLEDVEGLEREKLDLEQEISNLEANYEVLTKDLETSIAVADMIKDSMLQDLPKSSIFGVAFGGDTMFPARIVIMSTYLASKLALLASDAGSLRANKADIKKKRESILAKAKEIAELQLNQSLVDGVYELFKTLEQVQAALETINVRLRQMDDAQRQYRAVLAQGQRLQTEREIFRQRSAAVIQGYRTRDAAFRIFRDEKLERYKTLFDLAARYAWLAANAYDYETGLLDTDPGRAFIQRIVQARALGVVRDGVPQYAGSETGDPGLSSALAEMKADWDVLKGRLGFNNPDGYGTTVSLRTENFRILPSADGDDAWRDLLYRSYKANLLDDSDVQRYCMQIGDGDGLPVPGLLFEFTTTISKGLNLFGESLAAGDHAFSASSFATKLYAVGVALEGYRGMDDPTAASGAIGFAGGESPGDPTFPYLDPLALAANPFVYLIPVGLDSLRSPLLDDAGTVRTWKVTDAAVPLPFDIGASDLATRPWWQSTDFTPEALFGVRKHQAFRPVSTATIFLRDVFNSSGQLAASQYTNRRLIGRSVWNSKWKLVIPGSTLLNDPEEGLDRFIQTVKDVKLHFVTYSYAGN